LTQPAALSDGSKDPLRAPPAYKETTCAGERTASSFLINSLSSVTVMTAQLIFMLFIFLYTMFFFLVDGDRILNRMLYYLPLKPEDEERMLDRFTSVTRATLKGVAVIGILQGVLTGCAFAVIGIPSSIFWGTITAVMSLVPGIGTAIVWLPASIILASGGHYGQAIGLFIFCSLVVGGLDNFLRPRLVGQTPACTRVDSFEQGGLLFGPVGIISGRSVRAQLPGWRFTRNFYEWLPGQGCRGDGQENSDSPPGGRQAIHPS
jgi:predicted PurR-regulated permease PerM